MLINIVNIIMRNKNICFNVDTYKKKNSFNGDFMEAQEDCKLLENYYYIRIID